jgi:hypothetical protein
MPETGMFGTGKYHVADSQLPDSTKPLDLRTAYQFENESAWDGDESVDRIGEQFESAVQERHRL